MKGPTPDQLRRVFSNDFGFSDPCVICGHTFNHCPHTLAETEALIKATKKLTSEEREQILRKGAMR